MQQPGGQPPSAQQLQQQQQQHAVAVAAASRQMQLNGSVYGGQGSPSPRPGTPGMVRMMTIATHVPVSIAACTHHYTNEKHGFRRRAI
jgi:hypothetical protein